MIVGAPRSGTTWVGKIFDSHPDVLYRHEPDTVLLEPRLPYIIPAGDDGRYADIAAAYLDKLLRVATVKSVSQRPIFAKSYIPRAIAPLHHGMLHAARLSATLLDCVRAASFRLPEPFEISRHPGLRPVVKTINARGRMAAFLGAAPTMKVIFLLRHPGGQVASMLRGMKIGKMKRMNAFIEDVAASPAAARYGLTLEGLARSSRAAQWTWNWVALNELALDTLSRHDPTLIATYEDICADPVRQSKALFAFAKLDWRRQTEEFVSRSTHGHGDTRYYSVFRDTAALAGQWHAALGEDDRDTVCDILRQTPFARYWPDVAAPS
jgi:hypothetical protein